MTADRVLDRRRAGIVLHPTSLPGGGDGVLGVPARRFVDFLAETGFSVWQVLPLGPPHDDLSPYQSQSVHAGNTRLIDLGELPASENGKPPAPPAESGASVPGETAGAGASGEHRRARRLAAARAAFEAGAGDPERENFAAFRARNASWLADYALFRALREHERGRAWWDWPAPLRDREEQALAAARGRFAEAVAQHEFEQYVFQRQWSALRRYAHERGVLLFGDMPVFVAHDSADVWSRREYFRLDRRGQPVVIAGTPPDYFSATGQRWGNPHYDWDRMRADGYRWWWERVGTQLEYFDLVRVDHFRGFEAFWEVPASSPTAIEGRWVKGPGAELFEALQARFHPLPLVAEDLGYITREVYALRDRFGFPGMKVLQFAFDSGPDNPYLPHNHVENCVVYTGTHDNDTSRAWFDELPAAAREAACAYLGPSREDMPWPLIRAALASVARLAMLPMQDVLGLGAGHRLNVPGVPEGNWRWGFEWDQLSAQTRDRLRELVKIYGR